MIENIFLFIWFITFLTWLVWCIGYPIYKKVIKKTKFDWLTYTIGLNGLAMTLNLVNLFRNMSS